MARAAASASDVLSTIATVRASLGDANEPIFTSSVEFCLMLRVMLGFDCSDGRIATSPGSMASFRRF